MQRYARDDVMMLLEFVDSKHYILHRPVSLDSALSSGTTCTLHFYNRKVLHGLPWLLLPEALEFTAYSDDSNA